MSIFQHTQRALLLSLVAASGTAAAQGTPDTRPQPGPDTTQTPTTGMDGDTTGESTMSGDPNQLPQSADIDTTVTPPPPVVINNKPTYVTTPTYQNNDYGSSRDRTPLERYGIAVALGGGVEGFTNDAARTNTNDGGSWNLRLAMGTRSPIGFEAAYIGSAQTIDALGLDTNALLVGNGVEGKIRVNLVDANIQPFAFGGVGWRHYNLTRSDFNTSAISESDDVLELPVGAGIATKWQGFMFDARGEYRFATQENLIPSLNGNGGEASLNRWGVNANVGVAF